MSEFCKYFHYTINLLQQFHTLRSTCLFCSVMSSHRQITHETRPSAQHNFILIVISSGKRRWIVLD